MADGCSAVADHGLTETFWPADPLAAPYRLELLKALEKASVYKQKGLDTVIDKFGMLAVPVQIK